MINQTCPLVLSNLFEYDFSSCYYEMLRSINWDLNNIDRYDKINRNIAIGVIQKNNPRIASYLQSSVDNIIDYYIRENNVKDYEIILRQKDGLTITRHLSKTTGTLNLELRGTISKLIIDTSRKKWLIIYSNGDVVYKGFVKKMKNMSFFQMFRDLDFNNKTNLFKGLESIRKKVYTSKNIDWFIQEDQDNRNTLLLPVKNIGFIEINKSAITSITESDIDRSFLWCDYMWPFVESLFIHYSN